MKHQDLSPNVTVFTLDVNGLHFDIVKASFTGFHCVTKEGRYGTSEDEFLEKFQGRRNFEKDSGEEIPTSTGGCGF